MFQDRKDAGQKLAAALKHVAISRPLVLAIPRGGIQVAAEVAAGLPAAFAVLVVRKLPMPYNTEAGFGAIAEDGSTFLVPGAEHFIERRDIERIMAEQQEEIARRIAVLRKGAPLPALADRNVVLVDDGIAAGSTMRAAVQCCRNRRAGSITVAAPVSSAETKTAFAALADHVVVLETPGGFRAVADAYRVWYDVDDAEALEIIASFERATAHHP